MVARRKATVAAEITGKVVGVFVDEGMTVTEGQVVARLDSVLAEKDFELAKSRVQSADAAIGMISADLEDAQAHPDAHRGAVAEERRDRSGPDQGADARRRAVRAVAPGQRRSWRRAKIDAERSASVLGKHQIRAPFAGVVVDRSAQPGEMISPMSVGGYTRTGICTVVDMDSIEIEVDVNEAFIGRVVAGGRGERGARRLSGLDHPGLGDRDRADRQPREGDGPRAHPLRARRTRAFFPTWP